MRFFYDTEFLEDGQTIKLISLGMVSEKGREYYAQSCEFDYAEAEHHPFVKEHVLSHLLSCPTQFSFHHGQEMHQRQRGRCKGELIRSCPWRTLDQLRWELFHFVEECSRGSDTPPQFWGYFADYDHVVLSQLYGTMMDLPAGWPMYTRDLKQTLDDILFDHPGLEIEMPKNPEPHNALHDARWNRWLFEELVRFVSDQAVDPWVGVRHLDGQKFAEQSIIEMRNTFASTSSDSFTRVEP